MFALGESKRSVANRRFAALTVAAILTLTACGAQQPEAETPGEDGGNGGDAPQGDVIIGLSTQDLQNQYWLQLIEAFQAEAEARGVQVLVGTTNQDPAGQAQEVQNFLAQGAQAIAVSPVNPAAMQPVFDEAMEQGVHVVNNHFPAEFGHYDVFLDTGPYNSGYIAGSRAADVINEERGGEANCALLTLPENETLTVRMQGVSEALENLAPTVTVVEEQRAESQSDAETVVGNILTANPETDCILGWSDSVILGAVSAIKNQGGDPADYVMVGIDATEEALAALEAGEIDGTVNNPPDAFGRLAFEVAYGLVTDSDSPWHFVQHGITELQLVTEENLSDFQ